MDWLTQPAKPEELAAYETVEHAARDAKRGAGTNDHNSSLATAASAEWPELQDLERKENVKPYPIQVLPDGIREAVEEVLAFVQCPPALAACSALSALSLAGQGMANVQRATHLSGPTSLYLLAVAESGERKTTCDVLFLEDARAWERKQEADAKGGIAKADALIRGWHARMAGIEASIRDAAKKGEPTADHIAELEAVRAEEPQPFRYPRIFHADATPEALGWSLTKGWPCGGVMSSEAGVVFGGHANSSDSAMRNLSLLNSMWDGTSHRVERRSSESYTIDGARLTMGLAAQPETVRQFLEGNKGLARGNGFAARFLIAAPASTQGQRVFKATPQWDALEGFRRRIRQMLDENGKPDERTGRLAIPTTLTLGEPAAELWARFHDRVEAELRPSGEHATVRDVASKAADNAARLAALFHLYAVGTVGTIGFDAMRRAIAIVGWHLYQARAFLWDVAAPREVANARRLDAWLRDYCRRKAVSQVPRRDVQQLGPLRLGVALDAALRQLNELGRARETSEGRQKLVQVRPELAGGGDGAK